MDDRNQQAPRLMQKIAAFVILALLAMAAMHPNNRYSSPDASKSSQTTNSPPA
jgi:hypothetical protein